MGKIKFTDLGLSDFMLKGIEKKGYEYPSPIQEKVIPLLLNSSKDIIGQSQTGTGKTAAFAIPLLEKIDVKSPGVKAIVLCPTRELAIQVDKEIASFVSSNYINTALLYGGQSIQSEIRVLKQNPSIVVGTPGRVKDHLRRGRLVLKNLEYFVLDEADEMLNIGFREEIEDIFKFTPEDKKVLLFSATMPKSIMGIVKNYMKDYDMVSVKKEDLANSNIEQKYFEFNHSDKIPALKRIIDAEKDFYSIVFCRTKIDVDELSSFLNSSGYLAEGIHGDIEQKMREKILKRFRTKKINILVATDVAARGIDVDDVTHVVNFSIPENAEIYTHRIGRTARAGKKGISITFATKREAGKLRAFERVTKSKIEKSNLPSVKEVVENKKNDLFESIEKILKGDSHKKYQKYAKEMLELDYDAEKIISALLTKFCDKTLDEESYKKIDNNSNKIVKRKHDNEGFIRLFFAKGKTDGMHNPGNILSFLRKETNIDMKSAGRIDIYDKFSYIDFPQDEGNAIIDFFRDKDSGKPLVTKAKAKK